VHDQMENKAAMHEAHMAELDDLEFYRQGA